MLKFKSIASAVVATFILTACGDDGTTEYSIENPNPEARVWKAKEGDGFPDRDLLLSGDLIFRGDDNGHYAKMCLAAMDFFESDEDYDLFVNFKNAHGTYLIENFFRNYADNKRMRDGKVEDLMSGLLSTCLGGSQTEEMVQDAVEFFNDNEEQLAKIFERNSISIFEELMKIEEYKEDIKILESNKEWALGFEDDFEDARDDHEEVWDAIENYHDEYYAYGIVYWLDNADHVSYEYNEDTKEIFIEREIRDRTESYTYRLANLSEMSIVAKLADNLHDTGDSPMDVSEYIYLNRAEKRIEALNNKIAYSEKQIEEIKKRKKLEEQLNG